MRKVRYQVAMSLDGFIADSQDGYSWIPEEPDFDFAQLFDQFDTLLMGRRTFEAVTDQLANQFLHSHPGVDPADYLIAATAIAHGASLWTRNLGCFPMFEGLQPPY